MKSLVRFAAALLGASACAPQEKVYPPGFGGDMEAVADRAVAEARLINVDLNYEGDSVALVEEILAAYHELYKSGEIDDRRANVEALRFGAYIGETLKREVGEGTWSQDHPELGERTFPIHYRGGDSFPVLWSYRRITQGPVDNVWNKYTYYVRGQNEPSKFEIIKRPIAEVLKNAR